MIHFIDTETIPIASSTETGTATGTPTGTTTGTSTGTATGTSTGTATGTSTGTATGTSTGTATGTSTGTATGTSTGTATGTSTGGNTGTPGISIQHQSSNTAESGTTASFTVVLDSQTNADVVISFASNDVGEGATHVASLTFGNTDWNTPQTVTVTGQDDNLPDGNQAYLVTFNPSASSDANYNNLVPASLGFTNGDDDWWNTNWTRVRKLTFDNSGRSENLADFPVLVSLNTSRIDYSQTLADGEDLCFVDADGTTMVSHEIEDWNTNGTSSVWVKIPQIDASSTTDHVWMYYGSTQTCTGQNASQVWSDNFAGVWHFTNGVADSSANANDGTENGAPGVVAGKIADAKNFDGAADHITVAKNATLNITTTDATFEGWFRTEADFDNTAAKSQIIMEKYIDDDYNFVIALVGADFTPPFAGSIDGKLLFKFENKPAVQYQSTSRTFWSASQHYYFACVLDSGDSTNSRVYINGVLDAGGSYNDNTTTAHAGFDTDVKFAGRKANQVTGYSYFEGSLDEIRISSQARSVNWINAQYESMNDNFVAYGPESVL